MDIVTLGAALNGSAEYVNSHFVGGSNIQIVDNPDGTQTINASGEVSAEDTVARAEIAEIKDGETLDSFGDVETALADKVDKETGKGLSTNDYTTAEKTKLAGIEAQANKTTVDDALSGSSTNPVQNKVVKSALDSKANISDIPTVPITAIQKNGADITPVSGTVNIAVPTQASDINAATATQGGKADTAIQGVKVNSSTVNPDSNKVVSITVPTTAADVSALPDTTKYAVALSLTINSSTYVVTGQLKDQNGDNLGTAQTIDLPLESVVVGGSYNSQTKKVILTLQNGNTIEFSVADLASGLQTELSASNKLNPAYINYDSTHRAVSDTEKSTWNGKQDALTTSQLAAANSGIDSTKVEQIATNASDISDIETALDSKVDKETGKGLSTNDYTTAEKTKLAGIAEGAEVNVQSNWTQTTTTADDYIKNKPTLGTAAAKNATDAYNATGTDVTTGKAVAAALATLPKPMVFKGSLGTGGTITSLPTASSSNKGYVYKVITAGTYASQSAKVGDTFISDGSAWVLIPSGDEPSGTVTNVAVANGGGLTVSGSPITSSGTITVGHSNSVTAKTSSSVKKFTYDAHGHVTGSSELSTTESDALASGIDSTKVAQIETNKTNISTEQAKTTGMTEGGSDYITVNGIRVYVSATQPTGARTGDLWIGG